MPNDAADAVFECSGKREAAEQGLAMLRWRGTLVILGTGVTRPRFESMRILLNELTVTGAYNYDPGREQLDRIVEIMTESIDEVLGSRQ